MNRIINIFKDKNRFLNILRGFKICVTQFSFVLLLFCNNRNCKINVFLLIIGGLNCFFIGVVVDSTVAEFHAGYNKIYDDL